MPETFQHLKHGQLHFFFFLSFSFQRWSRLRFVKYLIYDSVFCHAYSTRSVFFGVKGIKYSLIMCANNLEIEYKGILVCVSLIFLLQNIETCDTKVHQCMCGSICGNVIIGSILLWLMEISRCRSFIKVPQIAEIQIAQMFSIEVVFLSI